MKECLSCYEEFTRNDSETLNVCKNCVPDPENFEDYRCPNCGWDSTSITPDEDAPVKYSKFSYNRHMAIEYGGYPEDWTEYWTCQECQTEFEYENASY